MTPQGSKGEWKWNGWEITSMGTDTSGEPFQRKGKWMWLPSVDDSQNTWMAAASVKEINEFYKPQANERVGEVLNKLILVFTVVVGIAVITMLIL